MYLKLRQWERNPDLRNWERIDPNPSLRHDKNPRFVKHRFEVKGGYTWGEVLMDTLANSNPVLESIMGRRYQKRRG